MINACIIVSLVFSGQRAQYFEASKLQVYLFRSPIPRIRIAVFGSTGRTGRPLVEQALERGHEGVAFVRDATSLSSTIREDNRVSVVASDARASDTRWTVVRGPRLTEDVHTGEFRHGTNLSLGMRDTAARANVAEFILDCLEDDLYIHEKPKVADA